METLAQFLIKNYNNGNYLIVVFILMVLLAFKYKAIIEFFDSRKKVKISKIEEALKCEKILGIERELLENELVNEYFKVTLGLNVEKEFREAIINAHKNTKGEIEFRHFQRGLTFFDFPEGVLTVKISKLEYMVSVLNTLILAFSYCFFIAFLLYGIINFTWAKSIPAFGFSAFCLVICIFLMYDLRHIISAKKIKKYLAKNNKE